MPVAHVYPPKLLHQLRASARHRTLDLDRGSGCGLYIPQLANSGWSSLSFSPPPPSPPPRYSALLPAAGAPPHSWLARDAPTWGGTQTVLSLPSGAESDNVGEERVKDTALPTGAVCLLVVLHFPLRVMHPSSLGNCCKMVLARQHPLKHSIVTSSATVPASSAASLKCFENGSYPEPFHLSLSCVPISSRSVCAPYLG